jgi:hypothetical protein
LDHIENYAKSDQLGKTRWVFDHIHRESPRPL